jgi:hypothetical protein
MTSLAKKIDLIPDGIYLGYFCILVGGGIARSWGTPSFLGASLILIHRN